MALNIKNAEVERLAAKLAKQSGKTKTEVIRAALLHEEQRFDDRYRRGDQLRQWLEEHVWPQIDPKYLGKGIPQEEQDEILGYGPDGYCV